VTVRVWDVAAGLPVGPAAIHPGEYRGAVLSPHGDRVATFGDIVHVVDPVTGRRSTLR
jgi:hypothetical protein